MSRSLELRGSILCCLRKFSAVLLPVAATLMVAAPGAQAQGILTVTPGRTLSTTAGTGTVGYSGDGGPAAGSALAAPSAVAYDANGNLYIADANNHVIREVTKTTGVISTVAGTGVAGFSGDGGAATSAQLDTPTGIAVDASGNLYIADSHNQRIRKVSGGTITTIAGTGTAGFSGDGGSATAAELSLPSAVAVDSAGNLYIADTNNQRIREVSNGIITTIAGTGDQGYSGDGGSASAAMLDSPTGVAVDAAGHVYIADRHNQRVREISDGTITTVAGSGTPVFGGGFGGDGAAATAATLANPTGVAVDAAGNVYISDTNNQRLRQVSGGAIATVAGTGEQGFGGDGSVATGAALNAPKAVAADVTGDVAIADTQNQRVRAGVLPALTFASAAVGAVSSSQPVTLSNTGTASLTVSSATLAGPFSVAPGGNCSATPITLAPGASCTENVAYAPTAAGAANGSITFSGQGVTTSKVLLAGTATQGAVTVTLTTSAPAPFINQPVTFTAKIAPPAGGAVPMGTVNFYAGTVLIGTAQNVTNGAASVTTSFGTPGNLSITAVYSGDANYVGATSAVLVQPVGDFDFTIIPQPSNPGGSVDQTVAPGGAATFHFTIQPLNGPFSFPITLSATGLPSGATVTFSPSTVTLGASPAQFSMTIQTARSTSMLFERMNGVTGSTMAFALLILPFARRRKIGTMRPLLLALVGFGSFLGMLTLSGCGTESGFFGQPQHSYTIQVMGTATGSTGATLQHVTSVTLTVQ